MTPDANDRGSGSGPTQAATAPGPELVNRLAEATSPYLQQHRDNPVAWQEWGDEAFELARRLDRPVLLSVGYAACHWCHVMAHESFEDAGTAALMNQHFVNVKVDREERPDVDAVYMAATQALTGQGGWPMTVFLTPQGRPFYAGTYFPPRPRPGMPSFPQLLQAIAQAWREQRDGARGVGRPDRRRPRRPAARGRRRPGRRRPRGGRPRARRRGGPPVRGLRGRPEVPAVHEPGAVARSGPTPAPPPGGAVDLAASRPGRAGSRSASPRARCARWRAAACTTSSPAVSPGMRWTTPGSCRTSRRCSTTTRSSPGSTCTGGGSRASRPVPGSPRRPATGWSVRSARRRAGSPRRSTPTPRARRRGHARRGGLHLRVDARPAARRRRCDGSALGAVAAAGHAAGHLRARGVDAAAGP